MWKVFRAEHQLGRWPIRVLVLAAFPILAAGYVQGESGPPAKSKPKLIIVQDKLPANLGDARWGRTSRPVEDRETVGSTIVIERSLAAVAAGERADAAQPSSTLTIKRELPPSPRSRAPSTPPLPPPPSFPAVDRPLPGSSASPAAKTAEKPASKTATGSPRGKSTLSERKSVEVPQNSGADKAFAEASVAEPLIFVAGRKKEEVKPPQDHEARTAEPVQPASFVTGGSMPNPFPGGPSNSLAPPLVERPAWDGLPGWTIISMCVMLALGLALALLALTVILLMLRLQNAGSQVPNIHVEVAQPSGAGVSVPVPVLQTVEHRRPGRPKRPRRHQPSVTSPAPSPVANPAAGRVADFGADILGTGALGAILGASRPASAENSGDREQSMLQQIYEDNLNLQRANE